MPPWRNWQRSPPVPGRLPGRIRQEAPLAGCSVGRGAIALNNVTTLVRFQPGQLAPFGSASACPWYGHVARLDTGEGLHADVAQGSERFLAKEEAPGSRPGIRS